MRDDPMDLPAAPRLSRRNPMPSDQPTLADALAKHMCEIDTCTDPAPCLDHLTVAGVALKFLGNTVDAAYQRGLAEGRRVRDEEIDRALGVDERTGPPPVAMIWGYNRGLAEGRIQGYDACADELNDKAIRAVKQAFRDGEHQGLAGGRRGIAASTDEAYKRGAMRGQPLGITQSPEGREREWLVETPQWWTSTVVEADARKLHAHHGGKHFSRLVGPREPAEQTEAATGRCASRLDHRASGAVLQCQDIPGHVGNHVTVTEQWGDGHEDVIGDAAGASTWEVRGYIANYGPYASLSWSSGYNTLDEARTYFARTVADTHAALVLLVESRPDGWERIADRWRPDAEVLAFEREMDVARRTGRRPAPVRRRHETEGGAQ